MYGGHVCFVLLSNSFQHSSSGFTFVFDIFPLKNFFFSVNKIRWRHSYTYFPYAENHRAGVKRLCDGLEQRQGIVVNRWGQCILILPVLAQDIQASDLVSPAQNALLVERLKRTKRENTAPKMYTTETVLHVVWVVCKKQIRNDFRLRQVLVS